MNGATLVSSDEPRLTAEELKNLLLGDGVRNLYYSKLGISTQDEAPYIRDLDNTPLGRLLELN
jgi:hypothetical protein